MPVSIERFASCNPELFKATADFVKLFKQQPDPIIAEARHSKSTQEAIAWTLLGTDLFQSVGYSEFSNLIQNLHRAFPKDALWKLPVPTEKSINDSVEKAFNTQSWDLFPNVAGIIWSVGAFVRHHGDLASWVKSKTAEGLWRDLGEIYFMGKDSPRPKACAAIYRIISEAPVGLGIQCKASARWPHLPISMGCRRYISILGPASEDAQGEGFASLSAKEKQALTDQLSVALAKEAHDTPYTAAHSLQYFLENGKDGFICRHVTNHCKNCPLYKFCSYADHCDFLNSR